MKVADYLKLNWSLIPITEGKIPAIPWKQYQTIRATMEEIKDWYKQGWTFGLVTGSLSGIVVVDDDRLKHGLNEWGIKSSVVAKTKSGGKHYYFRYSPGIRNTANVNLHLDIRGEGGYVKLPPFAGYEWEAEPTPENIAALTPIPDDLLRTIQPPERVGEPVSLPGIVGTPEGGRDDSLLRLANSLCNRFPANEWENGVWPILKATNNTFNPPLPDVDVWRIYNQATRFVSAHPVISPVIMPYGGTLKPTNHLQPHEASEVAKLRADDRKMEKLAPLTGYTDLDNCYQPLVPGRLAVLTGDTNVGKTAFACNLVHRITEQGKTALYFALEPDRALIDYLVSIKENKPFSSLTDADIEGYTNQNLKIFSANQVRTLESLVETVKQLSRFDVIVVDHIGYFTNSKALNINVDQSEVLKQLALLAQDKMTHILIVAHLNKSFEAKPTSWIPTMNQISGTASFKQDADDVLIIARQPKLTEYGMEYTDKGAIVVAKTKSPKLHRFCPLVFDPSSGLITGRQELNSFYETVKKTFGGE